MKSNTKKVLLGTVIGVGVVVMAGLITTGWQIGWGPFEGLFKGFEDEVAAIEKKYDADSRQHEIVFYGASNFRLWTQMEQDLSQYKVQNHGFGGSTDALLVQYADRLLYPCQPDIVVFQTGSNDYVNLAGTDEEKVTICIEYKQQMFETFHEKLPDAKFIVMSGLLMPGRSQYTELIQAVNRELETLCDQLDYLYFVDASALTLDGKQYAKDLFVDDGIHLNHDGQLRWRDEYIRPQLEKLIEMQGFQHLRK